MSDLLGNDFTELIAYRGENIYLSPSASMFVPLDRGTIFIWSAALQDAATSDTFRGELNYVAKVIGDYRRTEARQTEPLEQFFLSLFNPEPNECEITSFVFTTRETLTELANKATIGRLQAQLVEYNLLRQVIPNRGPRPAVFEVKYPFEPIEPKRVDRPVSKIDVSEYQILVPSNDKEDEYQQQLIELSRQALHKSRPHDTLDDKGRLIKNYTRKTQIRSPEGAFSVLEVTSETFDGSDVAVMTKRDEYIFGILKAWCLDTLRQRKKLGKPLDDWYVIEPSDLAAQLGYKDGRNKLNELREMMERWKDTRVRAELVDSHGVDDDGEYVSYLTQNIITQFKDHKTKYKVLPSGKRVLEALAFKLTDSVQEDLQRRAMDFNQNEPMVQGVIKTLQRTSHRTLMTNSFAIALVNFFWNWAHRYYQGWDAELWQGFSEMFDFEFPSPSVDMSPQEQKRVRDSSRVAFNRHWEKFLDAFCDDPSGAMDIWKGTKGGDIVVDRFPEFSLTIRILERQGRNQRQRGHIYLKKRAKGLGNSTQDRSQIEHSNAGDKKPVTNGLSFTESDLNVLLKDHSQAHVALAVQLMEKQGEKIREPVGWLLTILNKYSPEQIEAQLEPFKSDNRSSRKRVSAAVMDISDTSW